MSLALHLVARTLPAPVRGRYLEEWRADLEASQDIGVTPGSIVAGAVMTAVTLDRAHPAVSGVPRARLAAHRARWAFALLAMALITGTGMWFWGGWSTGQGSGLPPETEVLGTVLQPLVGLASVSGLILAALSATSGLRRHRLRVAVASALIVLIGCLALTVPTPVFALIVAGVLFATAFATAIAVVAADAGTRPGRPRPAAGLASRTLVGAGCTIAVGAILAVGAVQILVWNPLAKVPGITLPEVYAAMAPGDVRSGITFVVGWSVVWLAVALVFALTAVLAGERIGLTLRRVAVLALVLVGGAAGTYWMASFSMGMSIADTFMTGGGDATGAGAALMVVGQFALVAAAALSLPPAPLRPAVAGGRAGAPGHPLA